MASAIARDTIGPHGDHAMTTTSRTRRLTLVVTILMSLGLSACNTVKGFGQDVQNAAQGTEKAIDRATR
jgi:predicted small secreted protein